MLGVSGSSGFRPFRGVRVVVFGVWTLGLIKGRGHVQQTKRGVITFGV